jgi:type IV secretory pathway protease TraF
LLVQKNVYDFRPPRRWEVVVLKNAARPTPPFVKRIVGLPHESVQIIDGDVYANGQICRKSLDQQRAVRIPVFDNDYLPNDPPQGQGDWLIEPSSHPWKTEGQGHGFAIAGGGNAKDQSAGKGEIAWLVFRHWVRRGGRYKTEVPLAALPADVHLARTAFAQVSFDSGRGRLVSTGALAGTERDRLLATNADSKVRAAINELYDRSHEGPVTDDYGYNRAGSLVSLGVRDVMLACDVAFDSGAGEVLFEIGDGQETYRLSIDRSRKEAQLTARDRGQHLRTAACPQCAGSTFKLELSIFDRQVAAAVDGVSLFPAWECPTARAEPPRRPLRIGARGAAVRIAGLKVYRDIYYTRGQGRHGVDRPIRLAADEFFVLGDNSPISNDGRSWAEGAVRISQLIGKPLVVHLPSRPGRFTFGGYTRYIRIPDFSRMRYIR